MSFLVSYILATYRVACDNIAQYYYDNTNSDTKDRIYGNSEIDTFDKYKIFFSGPTHIIDNIYLGSAYNAANYHQLSNLGIEIVINVTKEISMYFPEEYEYKKLELYDNDKDDIEKYLEESYEYIKRNKHKKIFIHCKMGASRSVSILLYYMVKEHKMKLDDALKMIKEKRIIINPNNRFITILKKYD